MPFVTNNVMAKRYIDKCSGTGLQKYNQSITERSHPRPLRGAQCRLILLGPLAVHHFPFVLVLGEDNVISKQLEPDTFPEPTLLCLSFVIDFSEFLSRKKVSPFQGKKKESKGRQSCVGTSLTTGPQATPTSGWYILTDGEFLRTKDDIARGVWVAFWGCEMA
jgi:hypothetical protein